MKHFNQLTLFILCIIIISSCKKEDVVTPIVVVPSPSNRVLVTCEGSFGNSNSSLSIYNTETEEVQNAAFEAINGYSPGDVLQSMAFKFGKSYMVVNGSARIEVIDRETLVAETPITGAGSPRVLLPVGASKAYVSNIFSDEVQILDLDSKTFTGSIDIGGWSEGMVSSGGKVYITRNNGDQVLVIDPNTDEVTDSISVSPGPKDLVVDTNNDLWVLGSTYDLSFNVVDAVVTHISTSNDSVVGVFDIPQPWSYTLRLQIDDNRDQLFILNNKLFYMGINDSAISSNPIVDNGQTNYGLGIDPSNGDIYLGHGDFSSDGTVGRYDFQGNFMNEFSVGIAPNGFYFE